MKYTIITLSLLLIVSTSFGQKIELGFNMGAGLTYSNSIPENYKQHGILSACSALGAAYNIHHMQLGLQVSAATLKYKVSYDDMYGNVVRHEQETVWLESGYFFKAFANHTFVVKTIQFYTGLSAGYMPGTHDHTSHRYGWTAGLQLGGTWFFKKHFGLNLDLGTNYVQVNYRSLYTEHNASLSVLNFPASFGIRYRFLK